MRRKSYLLHNFFYILNFRKHNNVFKLFPLKQMQLFFPPLLCLHVLSCSPVVFFPRYPTDSDTLSVPSTWLILSQPLFLSWSIGHG